VGTKRFAEVTMPLRARTTASSSVADVGRRKTGALEAEVMAHLSNADVPLTPTDLVDSFDGTLAYTTLTTILTRLAQKGLVERHRVGRSYAYTLTVREADVVGRQLYERLHNSGDRSGVLQRFIAELTDDETGELREILEQLDRS
jgi:predicted transcriptional regulator